MVRMIADWLLHALALYIVALIVPGIQLEGFGTALLAVIIIGLLNALVKPILILLTLPINILTLGLFTFIINAVLLLLAGAIVPGFHVDGLGAALLGSILLSLVTAIFHGLVK